LNNYSTIIDRVIASGSLWYSSTVATSGVRLFTAPLIAAICHHFKRTVLVFRHPFLQERNQCIHATRVTTSTFPTIRSHHKLSTDANNAAAEKQKQVQDEGCW
jgi:hypothetical protein